MRKVNFVSYAQLHQDVREFARKIDADGIVGVPRSGLMVAHLLALQTHIPVLDLPQYLAGAPFFSTSGSRVDLSGKRILVVDDSCGSGRTMTGVMNRVAAAGLKPAFGAIYSHEKNVASLDLWGRKIPSPRMFEWNLWRHYLLRRALVDFDGVLCPDPPRDDDRADGPYARHLADAPVLFRPIEMMKGIVTNRLEKWRTVSETWLDRRGIRCQKLVMARYDTAAERRAKHGYGIWKGEVYEASDASLFVESSAAQASQIFSVARKPVLCVDTMQMYQ